MRTPGTVSITEARTGTLSDWEWATKHRYAVWPQGICAPGVTTVTGLLDNGKAGAFAYAAAKLTREGVDYKAEWEAKAREVPASTTMPSVGHRAG